MAEETQTEARENPRKIREGIVASTKMDKTLVVVATDRVRHRRYNKTVQRDKRLYVPVSYTHLTLPTILLV